MHAMKFAKELERDAVPEWRIKYLNYKAGKKYVKAVSRAINRSPRSRAGYYEHDPRQQSEQQPLRDGYPVSDFRPNLGSRPAPAASLPSATLPEDEPLNHDHNVAGYGSIGAATPVHSLAQQNTNGSGFALPDPALPAPSGSPRTDEARNMIPKTVDRSAPHRSMSSKPAVASRGAGSARHMSPASRSQGQNPPSLRRILTYSGTRDSARQGYNMESFDLVRVRAGEFYDFLDSELGKVEKFYRTKEEQAGQRLVILREQLHEMRNRRLQEIAEGQLDGPRRNGNGIGIGNDDLSEEGEREPKSWTQPLRNKIFRLGPNSKAMQAMPATPHLSAGRHNDAGRDYVRRPKSREVPYRTAKRKLKLALQEFYRGLELLKSYALLNRTAFRKLNKKFDKAVNARPSQWYVNEKVNEAWFVKSDVLDRHMEQVEDLYARYFERGNRKLAVGKLRNLDKKHSGSTGGGFTNGLMIGTGAVFAVQAVVSAGQLLFDENPTVRSQTSYLLQIYGGYFLMLLLFFWFCFNGWLWTKNKVNYPFIFEFDPRHNMDWKQLAVFPSFFLSVLGIIMWFNFGRYGADEMYLYYPVVLIGFTALFIFLPVPYFAYRGRAWLAYSHWRLLLAGLYPVEFRDFFLGDMYCSLTYATANVELFFCLYHNHWDNPIQCNSGHSRLLGFFTALPPIWRLLQCLRRYRDTGNVFPHLVNGGKYSMSITAAVMLSLYRISDSKANLALFIVFSSINAVYCSIWDLFMDFSLLQAQSRHRGLRDILAFKSSLPYYAIMIADPILRFSWIFYAIFTHNAQHSTIVSFSVALMEVVRRGCWSLFRVENEHCANVAQYKASRDVPLPYRIEPLLDHASESNEHTPILGAQGDDQEAQTIGETGTSAQEDTAATTGASTLGGARRRQDTKSGRDISRMLAEAHRQDFEKRRKPVDGIGEDHGHEGHSDDDDEEEEEEEEEMEHDRAAELRHRDSDDEV